MKLEEMDELLVAWASWKARRADAGLGYKVSALAAWATSDQPAPAKAALLPPDVDVDERLTLVDSAVCLLPRFHFVVINEWYFRTTDEAGMLKRVGVSRRSFFVYLRDARELCVQFYHELEKRRRQPLAQSCTEMA
ncbi:hypothetical protein [Crenobacter caeni]|uniref:Antitermination protein n=1 Tax=Crenobacter caeni TaxID=2705474 RepID=A0A6B2KNB0_9NEIS|nr:hypothetical protein [Crenobacter caeni]NDV11660.1 hypothetical protein [Crenobacter caeni]